MSGNRKRTLSINNRFGFGINKMLSVLMLAACLVFLFLQSKEAEFSLTWYFVAVCAALVIVLIPWRYVGRPVKSERAPRGSYLYGTTAGKASGRRNASIAEKRALQIMFVLTPLAAYWITNKATDAGTDEIFRKLFSLYGLLNIVIIVAVLFVFYVIFNRTKIAIVLTIVLAMVLGIVDCIMLLFRGSPLIAADIASAGTGMDVLSNYTMTFNSGALWIITASVIYISVAVSFKSSKGLGLKGRLVLAAVTVVCVGGLAGLFFFTDYLENQGVSVDGYRPDKSYEEYGTVLGFAATMTDTKMKEPEGYSKDAVEKIASEYPSDKASAGAVTSKKTPDIIVVMNESFSDLEALADIGTSKEYIPYFNSLRKNTIRGTLHTSVLGGGTSITEHEFLTGNTSAFLPLHKAIYNDGITGDSPSLASTLKEQGYGGNIAFHPGQADSYNRSNVYPLLGFDKFISVEDMKDPEKVRNYVSDKADYERVIAEYEKYKASKEKAPFFMFNVTIQNHGGYTLAAGKVDKTLKLTEKDCYDVEAEQFINLMKISDDALKELIGYFEKRKEPVVIVMFGDHQPKLSDEFYAALGKRISDDESDLQKEERKYRAPFMIWANYDIGNDSGAAMSVNYFAPYVKSRLGLALSGYDKFLLDTYKEIPVITGICYMGKDGKARLNTEKTEYSDTINDYRMIEYNCLADTENRAEGFFSLKGTEKQ